MMIIMARQLAFPFSPVESDDHARLPDGEFMLPLFLNIFEIDPLAFLPVDLPSARRHVARAEPLSMESLRTRSVP